MTLPRARIAISLAERGRPANWATEREAAELSGVGADVFRSKVKGWEERGFPQINPENGKRSIPGILAYWGLPANHSEVMAGGGPVEDDDGQENWNGQGERRAS